jgi:hypothetical protein
MGIGHRPERGRSVRDTEGGGSVRESWIKVSED